MTSSRTVLKTTEEDDKEEERAKEVTGPYLKYHSKAIKLGAKLSIPEEVARREEDSTSWCTGLLHYAVF